MACGLFFGFVSSCDTEASLAPIYNDYYVKYYGTEGTQYGVDLLVSEADESLILLGTTYSGDTPPIKRVFLVKTDFSGNIIWEHVLGGTHDVAKDIEFSNDGGFVVLTETEGGVLADPTDQSKNFKILKLSVAGEKLDSIVYSTPKNSSNPVYADEFPATISSISSGYIVTGSTTYKSAKADKGLNNVGDILHVDFTNDLLLANVLDTTLSDSQNEYGYKTVELAPNMFYTFGSSYKSQNSIVNDNFNFWVVPNSGDNFPLGISATSNDEKLKSICPSSAPGGYFLVGSHTLANASDIYVGSVYKDNGRLRRGAREGIIKMPGHGDRRLDPVSVCQAKTGGAGYLVLSNEGASGFRNIWLAKISDTDYNNVMWSTSFGAADKNDDTGGAVAELPDGRIVVLGTINLGSTNFRMALFKVNSFGQLAE